MDRRAFALGLGSTFFSLGTADHALAQVVSRLALGPDEVLVLSDGAFDLPLSMTARDVPLRELETLAGAKGPVQSVLNVTCLKRGKETILFDCGAGANFLPGSGKLAASLEAAGIPAESVTHVLFTHLHPDHFWGALDDFDSAAFPNATWLAGAAELDFWTDPKVYEQLPEDRHAFAAGAQRIAKGLGGALQSFKAGDEPLPGVLALATPGHTPGHVSFEIRTGSDSVLVLGDAATHAKISFQHPDWRPAADHDAERGAVSRKQVLARAADEKLRVVGYHLASGGAGRVERAGAAFRFVPGSA